MRRWALIAVLPLAACSLGSPDEGSANAGGVAPATSGTSRSYPVAGFTGIDLRGSDDVDVRVGGAFSVRATGPSEMLDRLRIEKVGDTLRIDRKSDSGFSIGAARDVKILVAMPAIAAATITGSGDMHIDRVTGDAFAGATSGSGGLTIANLATKRLRLSIAGSGDVSATGATGEAAIQVAGSGDVNAADMTATQATVSVQGSGNVQAHVNGPAKVSVMGSGDVDLGDQARCTVAKMGSGEVRCGG